MSIVWFNEKPKGGIATFYEGNITLNKYVLEKFETAYSVMLGIDYQEKEVLIKPLSLELDQRGDISEKQKYKITLRSSYGRISSKEFMKEIASLLSVDFKENSRKFNALWDESENLLRIDLKKEVSQ